MNDKFRKRVEELIRGTVENLQVDADQPEISSRERQALHYAAAQVEEIGKILDKEMR